MAAYGNASANSANVVYPFDSALPAARAVNVFSQDTAGCSTVVGTATENVLANWIGPYRDKLATDAESFRSPSATNLVAALDHLAGGIAVSWAAARGQQDRINHARYVEWDIAQDNMAENAFEFFAGETDYGPPPSDPATPAPDGYAETRSPIRAEFQ